MSSLLAAVLLVLQCTVLTESRCLRRESCSDQHVEALGEFPESAGATSAFRVRVQHAPIDVNSSATDCKRRLDVYSLNKSKSITGFHIYVCSDDGQGYFETNLQSMNIQLTSCQAPFDTATLVPAASLEYSRRQLAIQLFWIAPCQQDVITISCTVLDNDYERHGPIEEVLHTVPSNQKYMIPSRRLKRAMPDTLVLANRYYIHQISLDGTRVKTLVSGLQRAIAIDFHYSQGYLFWTDPIANTISRSNLDGSMRTTVLDQGLDQPEGLAVDWVTDKLYWTDTQLARIGVLDLTTNQSRILISTGSVSLPRAIVVDPNTRMMYWTDWGSNTAIESASMDGNNRAIIHNTELIRPYALTLDYSAQKLYWIDARNDVLESSNVDGTNRIDVLTSGIEQPFSVTIIGDTIYWTDWRYGIRTFNATGSGSVGTLFNNFCISANPFAIQAISPQRQQEPDSNPCVNNGGCSHFCLLSAVASEGYSCACPDGMVLDANLLDCTLPLGNTVADVAMQGSCIAAGHVGCCTSGSCEGTVDTCYCDANCHVFGDCCSDVPLDCQSAPNGAYLIFTNQIYNQELSLDGRRMRAVASDLGNAYGIHYHIREDHFYWTDISQQKIWRARLDGTQAVAIVESNLRTPDDLSVDWVSNKLYWTDRGTQNIDVLDLTSGYRANIVQTGSGTNPRAIVLDPQNRLMYWTDWGDIARIEKASMDGANRVEIINTNLTWPNALTLDYQEQVLYWGDGFHGTIESSNVDGTNRRMIAGGSNVRQPFSITVFADTLYFTDGFFSGSIRTTNKSGGASVESLSSAVCGSVFGIEVVSASRQADVSTPCTVNNGGCSHLCLLSSAATSGYSCTCPDGMVLNSDQLTCSGGSPGFTSPPPIILHGTCADAGYTQCCVSGLCSGSTPSCYCELSCHSFGDCCSDIDTTCPLGQTIEFTQRPQEFTVIQLEDAEFQCNVTVSATFEWSFIPMDSSTPVLIANEAGTLDPKYSAVIGSTYSTVTVHNVQPMDQGLYTCSASSAFGNISATATLIVWVPPTVPQVTGSFAVMEQDTLQLQCTSSGYPLPMITWVKRSGEVASILVNNLRVSIATENFDSNSTTASTLQIHNTINEDRGNYQCEASNAAGTNTAVQTIGIVERDNCEAQPCQNGGACVDLVGNYLCNCNATFTGRNCTEPIVNDTPQVPTVVNPPMDTTAEIVHPVNLTCEAEGYPAPSYEWYLDGVLIPGEMLSYLYIPEAQPSDRGNYTCKTINDNGEIESHPALVNLTGVYQYIATVRLVNQASREEALQEAIQIIAAFSDTSTVMFYSVEIVNTNSSENVLLLFTMIGEEITPTAARQVLETELQALASAVVIMITRYDGCDADEEDGYSWPETNIETAVLTSCPCEELLGALAGKAVRYCSGTFTNGASWNVIDSRDCAVSTSTTTSTLCGLVGTPEEVSQEVMHITETAELVASDIAATVSILEVFNLTDQATFNLEVQNNYLQIVDNIQQANASAVLESQMVTQSSSRLLNNLGTFLDNVGISNGTNTTLFVLQTYALQAQDIDPRRFQGQMFNVDLGSVEEAMKVTGKIDKSRITTSALVMDAVTSATVAVQVPQSLLSNVSSRDSTSSNQRLSHTVFLTGVLFQTEDPNTTIGSIIVGVQLNSTLNFSLSSPLTIVFQTIQKLAENESESSCAVWNAGGFGEWSISGCEESTDSSSGQRVCSCQQLAHFGILFDLNPRTQSPDIALSLSIITYVLTAFSLVCLTAFILTYTISKKLRTSIHGQILINLSLALMGLYILFIIGGSAVPIPAVCGISSGLLHYFILVFFGWTTVEAIWLYLKIVKVLGTHTYEVKFILKAGLPTWLVPLLIVIISGGAGYKYYSNPFYCRPTQWPFYFGLILPFATLYVFNWVMYIVILVLFCRHAQRSKADKQQKLKIFQNFVVAITLAVVLGLGWGIGLLATSHNVQALTITFQIVFSIFVGLQGVLIFLLHGICNADARKLWGDAFLCQRKARKVYIGPTSTSDTSNRTNLPSSVSTDSGLTTLGHSSKQKPSQIDSSVEQQMETSVFDSEVKLETEANIAYGHFKKTVSPLAMDPNAAYGIMNTHEPCVASQATNGDSEYETIPEYATPTTYTADPPSSSAAGRPRRSLPQLFGRQTSQNANDFTSLQEMQHGSEENAD